jgi:hypothetical protein
LHRSRTENLETGLERASAHGQGGTRFFLFSWDFVVATAAASLTAEVDAWSTVGAARTMGVLSVER